MELSVFLAVLFAAALHAGWNALIRIGLDRFGVVLLLSVAQGGMAALMLPFVAAPAAAAVPWIVAAALIHSGYKLFLVQAYAHADLTQAYPLARGSAPLIVTAVSLVFLGERLSPAGLLAIGCISAGILTMAVRGGGAGTRMRGRALFFALATAAATASYTLVDGYGARIAGTASGFVLWMFLGDGIGIVAWALTTRGRGCLKGLAPALPLGIVAGAMSLAAYWIAVWAFTRAPIALVAALRETSILFAIAIGTLVLKERLTPWRLAAVALIAAGVPLMRL